MTALPAFDMQGQGDTAVLLLHGIGGGRSIWSDAASGTARALAEAGFRAVAIDLPGYGDSAAIGTPGMDGFVAAVRAVIDRIGARRTVLLGHSKIDTTTLYTRVATRTIHAVTSPLDRLMALMEGSRGTGAPSG